MSICPADNRPCDYSPCPRLGMCAPFSAKPYQPQNTRPREDALQAEVERLRKVLADAVALIDRSRLFKGYAGPEGPLSTHWADMVSQMAHAALKGTPHE